MKISSGLSAPFVVQLVQPMTSQQLERMDSLCRQIAIEKDPKIFDALVRELNEMLEVKERQIRDQWQRDPFVTKLN